jgi:hypothetical protein
MLAPPASAGLQRQCCVKEEISRFRAVRERNGFGQYVDLNSETIIQRLLPPIVERGQFG